MAAVGKCALLAALQRRRPAVPARSRSRKAERSIASRLVRHLRGRSGDGGRCAEPRAGVGRPLTLAATLVLAAADGQPSLARVQARPVPDDLARRDRRRTRRGCRPARDHALRIVVRSSRSSALPSDDQAGGCAGRSSRVQARPRVEPLARSHPGRRPHAREGAVRTPLRRPECERAGRTDRRRHRVAQLTRISRWCLTHLPQRTLHFHGRLHSRGDRLFESVLEDRATSHPSLRLNVVDSRPLEANRAGRDCHHQALDASFRRLGRTLSRDGRDPGQHAAAGPCLRCVDPPESASGSSDAMPRRCRAHARSLPGWDRCW